MKELNLLKFNRHWNKGFQYNFAKKREIFADLVNNIEKRQIVELVGLRRTGKTTLFFQLIDHLITGGVAPFSIWYFTFDEEIADLDDLMNAFSKQANIDYKKEKIFVFFDEIQKLKNFASQIKIYYDLYPHIKFFISGSTSLFIKKKTQESLAGRLKTFHLKPLSFTEFLYFKNEEEILNNKIAYRQEIEKKFENYLGGQFIESVAMDAEARKNYFVSIIKKVVFEDIPFVFPVDNPEILWRILKIVGQNPGIAINYFDLSRELGVSNKTISVYINYLEESFLLKKIYNFSRNLLTSEKKLKKFYLSSPSFSIALADFIDLGKLAENFIISLSDLTFFWRDAYKHEVDFVALKEKIILPIEIKYKSKIENRELKHLLIFAKKFKTNSAILLSKNIEPTKKIISELNINEQPIYFPPADILQ